MKNIYEGYTSFAGDVEKMHDFITLSMDEFLESYSYLDREDYYATYDELMDMSRKQCQNYCMEHDVFRKKSVICSGCAYARACFDENREVECDGYKFDGTNPDSYDALSATAQINCIDQFVNIMCPYADYDGCGLWVIEADIKEMIGEQFYIDEDGNWYDEGRKVRG